MMKPDPSQWHSVAAGRAPNDAGQRPRLMHVLQPLIAKQRDPDLAELLINTIQRWAGCRGVGLRLLFADGTLAYTAYVGFSQRFWLAENLLSVKCDHCACTRVASGRYEPQDLSAMTANGSFHAPDLTRFVGKLTEQELSRFRGRCIAEGLQSLAVVPITWAQRTVGLLHLGDDRAGFITAAMVDELEACTSALGELLSGQAVIAAGSTFFATPESMDIMLNGINVVAYVADPETHILLYANPTLRKLLPFDPVGRPCHLSLHGQERACPTCSSSASRQATPLLKERVYHTAQGKLRYLVIDRAITWADGRDVWLCFGVALSETD